MTKKPLTVPVKITDKQIEALKYLVIHSQDATELAKRIFCWLLDQTNNLTVPVRVNITPVNYNPRLSKTDTHCAIKSFGYMCGSGETTHLNEIMRAMGAVLGFSYHSGFFMNDGERVDGGRGYFAIWFAHEQYDRAAKLLDIDWNAVFDDTALKSHLYDINLNTKHAPQGDNIISLKEGTKKLKKDGTEEPTLR